MKLKLNRAILTSPDHNVVYEVEKGAIGEPVGFHTNENGHVTTFDMIFYGYSRIFRNIRPQDLELV